MGAVSRNCAAHAIGQIACTAGRLVSLLTYCQCSNILAYHCEGSECIYETKRVKPGIKAGAVENLHRRLDDLERRFEEQNRTPDTQHADNSFKTNSTNESTAHNILALLARELPKLIKPSENDTFTSPASHVEPSAKRRRLDLDVTAKSNALSIDYEPQLPSPKLLNDIVTAYFLHVHPWIPMVHQARFLQRFSDDQERKQLHIVLHAITIAASKFLLDAQAFNRSTEGIRKWVVATAMDCLSLESLQALIILAFNDIGNGNAAQAWSIVGSLTRTVEYTQLAQEQEDGEYRPFCQPYASLPPTSSWTEVEERRRVFWNVFLLDRFCSVTMGWNTSK